MMDYLFTCALRPQTSIRHCSGILIGFIMIDLQRRTRYLCICLDSLVCGNSTFLSLFVFQLWKSQICQWISRFLFSSSWFLIILLIRFVPNSLNCSNRIFFISLSITSHLVHRNIGPIKHAHTLPSAM